MDAQRIYKALISPVPAHVRRGWFVVCAIPVLIGVIVGAVAALILAPPILMWRHATQRRLRQGTHAQPWHLRRDRPRPYSPSARDRRDVAALRAALD